MTTREDRERLAARLVEGGADPTEARKTAGLPALPSFVTYRPRSRIRRSLANGPADPPARSKPRKKRARPRRRAARRVPRVRVASASTFGAIIAQAFGLLALYWVVRSAGAIGRILDAARSGVRWLVDPVGWSRSRT